MKRTTIHREIVLEERNKNDHALVSGDFTGGDHWDSRIYHSMGQKVFGSTLLGTFRTQPIFQGPN
jgi:hypothetical protein